MNEMLPDLFELLSRWDVEATTAIPLYLKRQAGKISEAERRGLLERRMTLKRVVLELRDMMAAMIVTYRGVVDGVVVIEAGTEDECWAAVGDRGTVEFKLSTHWAPTDSAIAHQH